MDLLWRGTLSFELVHVPIELYKATRRRAVQFRLLHEPDLAPIRYRKVCSAEDRPVPDEEIVRGYRIDGRWVIVEDEDLRRAAPTLTRSIRIREFVDLHEIDPTLYRTPYYLAAAEEGAELYVMLREAIRRSGKVGLAEFVLMHREHLAVVRTRGDALLLEALYYPEEIIDERELAPAAETRLREGEIRMAVQLIERRSRPFDPARYRNDYRARVLELIRQKAEGRLPPELVPTPAPTPTPIVDLTRRLRESLERVQRESRRRAA